MKLITVSGPPSCGKTSVIVKTLEKLISQGLKCGVIKFDSISSSDKKVYEKNKIPVKTGLAGSLCPDHFFVANIEEGIKWGKRNSFDYLITESAGLCNRCSPHIRNIPAVCVIDSLSGIETPFKIGPMLKTADLVVITKGDIISQAEREVFGFRVKKVNPKASIIYVNGLTGQGSLFLKTFFEKKDHVEELDSIRLRFSMPAALCSYCLGETKIGKDCQIGNIRTMDFT